MAIIGGRKGDSADLDPQPTTSHVARTNQEDYGRIFRRNIAYGSLTRHGTIFVGFGAEQRILRSMLESMVGVGGGPADQLISVTRPHTGSYYVIPSAERLAGFLDDRADA